uniref:Nuclear autoantigenic sperm protein n=1 Tax=Prolemur simus TaxID=1328070 RepID=A0A8C9ARU2_PROSS
PPFLDVDSEAKKLLGLGQKHLVMGDIPAAVNAFQEEAREELREQVYDAMREKEEAKKTEDKSLVKPGTDKEQESEMEKGGREDMDISEPAEELQEKVELIPDQLIETSEEAKGAGAAAPGGLNETEIISGKPEQEVPDAEEEKSVSETDIQEECREKGQEKQGEIIVSIEEKPKEASEEQPVVALEKQGIAVEVEGEPVDPAVKPVDVGGDEPKETVATSENETGKAVLEQLVGQEVPAAEESPEVTPEAAEASAMEGGSEVSEKPGQEATVLKDGAVNGLSAAGDQTPIESQNTLEGLTETKDGSGLEDKVRAKLVPSQEETKLSIEESEIAANEETQEREEQMKEEEEIGNLELAWDMLDLAKIIFKRQETKEAQLYAAQAHLKLGEVSVESENYIQAVEEFQACLTLQEQYLEAHDRLLAETHYQLGLAYGYNSQYDEAVAQFSKSIEAENQAESRAAVEGTVEAGATVESTAC